MRRWLVLVAVGCDGSSEDTAAPDTDVGHDTDTETDTDTDTSEPTELAWVATYGDAEVARAWMELELLPDGNEHLVGVSELSFEPYGVDIVFRLAEDVLLAPDGTPISWVQHAEHQLYAEVFSFRHELTGGS